MYLDRSQPSIWALQRRYETCDSTRPNNVRYDAGEASRTGEKTYEIAFALRQRKKRVMWQVPGGLVVRSDDDGRRKRAWVLRQCALAPVLVSTVAESRLALAGNEIVIVVCNDRLDDGKHEDIVKLVVRCERKVPEYLPAVCGGVFDYWRTHLFLGSFNRPSEMLC